MFPTVKYRLVSFYRALLQTDSQKWMQPLTAHKWPPVCQAKKHTRWGVHTQVRLQLTFVRDQTNNPRAAFFLGTALVFPSPACVPLSPTPDNEERGPVVKSYLKQSSELRLCANSSSVAQRVIGALLPATRTNASNNCAASNRQQLSSGALRRPFCAHSVAAISQSNAGNAQPFVSPQEQTVPLFSQRTKAKNELMSHRSVDLALKENWFISQGPAEFGCVVMTFLARAWCWRASNAPGCFDWISSQLVTFAQWRLKEQHRSATTSHLKPTNKPGFLNQLHLIGILRKESI